VTYSVIAKRGHFQSSGSVLETYKRIGQGLIASLERLGIRALLRRVGFGDAEHGETCNTVPCFTSSGRYEVTIGDRKVVGSAQRQLGEMVLQHGSLLTGEGHLKIAQFLPLGIAEGDKMAQELRDKTISLGALLLRPVSYTEVAEALFLGFQAAFQVPMEPGQLRSDEEQLAQRLIRERYGRQEWTLRR
jgi:lipoate-protein ligase A